jgi:hypothetical protein
MDWTPSNSTIAMPVFSHSNCSRKVHTYDKSASYSSQLLKPTNLHVVRTPKEEQANHLNKENYRLNKSIETSSRHRAATKDSVVE